MPGPLANLDVAGPGVPTRRRARRLMLVSLLLLLVLCLRLVWVQGLDPFGQATKAVEERMRTQSIAPQRGAILDRDGDVLAASVQRFDLVVDQRLVKDFQEWNAETGENEHVEIEDRLRELSGVIGIPEDELKKLMVGDKPYAVVKRSVTPQLRDLALDLKIPGLIAEPVDRRMYPNGPVAGSIVGFLSADGVAQEGMEVSQQEVLAGTPGRRQYEVAANGVRIPNADHSEIPAVDGSDLRLTIDKDAQWYAQELIAAKQAEYEAEWGNIVVMDVKTGEVIAMADSTTVDPADPKGVDQMFWRPTAMTQAYEAGSTGKALTMAASLDASDVTAQTGYDVPSKKEFDGETINDASPHAEYEMTVAGIFARSYNVGTVQVAQEISDKARHEYMKEFGIGEPIHVGMPYEASGRLGTPDDWDRRTRLTTMFGQGYSQTTLHTAQMYQAMANGGVLVPARLIDATVDASGAEHRWDAGESRRVIEEDTSKELLRMMETVVTKGSSKDAQIPGYRVGGKSSTAQAAGESGTYDGYNLGFTGVAPLDDPRFVVSVSLHRPEGRTLDADVDKTAAEMLEFMLRHENVPATGDDPHDYDVFVDDPQDRPW